MAVWSPKKINPSQINAGQQYADGNDFPALLDLNDTIQGVMKSDENSENALTKSTTAETNSTTALTKSETAERNSSTALTKSNQALEISEDANEKSEAASTLSKIANNNSEIARNTAQSVRDDADAGLFDGERGESGINVPLETGFFRTELRADGNLWVVTSDGMTSPLKIVGDDLILTI